MKVTKYNLILDENNRIPSLIKETAGYYPTLSKVNNSREVTQLLNTVFQANLQTEEHGYLIALRSNKIIGVFDMSHGGVNLAYISPREVFSRLLLSAATDFIIAHNHPSGDVKTPSKEDWNATRQLKAASSLMNITMLDHVIVGEGSSYFSFNDATDIFSEKSK